LTCKSRRAARSYL